MVMLAFSVFCTIYERAYMCINKLLVVKLMSRSKIKSRVASVHRSSGCLFQKSLVTVLGILFNIINTENFTCDLQRMINGSNWNKILNSYVTLLLIIGV